jgi:methylase of polypeptide subunit release factors
MATAHLTKRSIKANGVHYTPPALASFLAEETMREAPNPATQVTVLDPACGDGSLLAAIAEASDQAWRSRLRLVGYETDAIAASTARERLERCGAAMVDVRNEDFLEAVASRYPMCGQSLFSQSEDSDEQFHIVISNPPYVRTQQLGATKAQQLAETFGLSGRVDLYHAFVKAISLVLRPGGVLGLLTSNRFMFVQSGASVRELLRSDFLTRNVYDLGDTKLFSAAVLPAIVVARRKPTLAAVQSGFTRVYQVRSETGLSSPPSETHNSIFDALRDRKSGDIKTGEGRFRIEQGQLDESDDLAVPWSLSSTHTRTWLTTVRRSSAATFGEIAQIRVGLKTTADGVFIRDDWDSLPDRLRPESELLFPLITHHVAARWRCADISKRKVLYPHEEGARGEKRAVDLANYPRARAYLETHRERLESRKYVIAAGRKWFEIWVPQQPADWRRPKVVYPDISEEPRFFLNTSGAIVNGDCYWITLNDGVPEDYLLLLLAVANSRFATSYYDTVFHNKLYAGRRRFMTQYVREFPLPHLERPESQEIITLIRILTRADASVRQNDQVAVSNRVDCLVTTVFRLHQG